MLRLVTSDCFILTSLVPTGITISLYSLHSPVIALASTTFRLALMLSIAENRKWERRREQPAAGQRSATYPGRAWLIPVVTARIYAQLSRQSWIEVAYVSAG